MNKLLTIIIPTYNMATVDACSGTTYIEKCLTSLILENSELMDQLEVLVINDGSKDGSSEIAHSYQKCYPNSFRVIDKENGNYGSCINRGLKEATGKYIKVLDADDWFDTKVFEDFVKYLSTVNVDLVISKCKVVEEHVGTTYDYSNIDIFEQGIVYKFNDWADKIAERIVMHNIAYNRDIFNKINYYQTTGISYTDTEWVFKPMQKVETLVFFDSFLYYYLRGREGQTMNPNLIQKQYSNLCAVGMSLAKTYDNISYTEAYQRFMEVKMENYFHWILFTCGMIFDNKTVSTLLHDIKRKTPKLYSKMKQWKYRQTDITIEYIPLFESPLSYVKNRVVMSGISETIQLINTATDAGILQINTTIKILNIFRRIKRNVF